MRTVTFIDDSSADFDTVPALAKSLALNLEFDKLSGQVINFSKTLIWSTENSEERDLLSAAEQGEDIKFQEWMRLVGYTVQAVGLDALHLISKRVQSALTPLTRIQCLPCGMERRAYMIASVATARVNVGLSTCRLDPGSA
eukprot:6061754-Pyramimonas_sp.AAC.2